MNAINSLPIKTPAAAMQQPRTKPASEKDSQTGSFESLLYENGASADEQASAAGETLLPVEVAKYADGDDLPSADEIPALVAMIPIQPMPTPLPTAQAAIVIDAPDPVETAKRAGEDDQSGAEGLSSVVAMPPNLFAQAIPSTPLPPVPATEVRVDDLTATPFTATPFVQTPAAPVPCHPLTTAVAMPFEPARPAPAVGEMPAESPPNAWRGPAAAAPHDLPESVTPAIGPNVKAAVTSEVPTLVPAITLPVPRGLSLATEPFAEAAPALPGNSSINNDTVPADVVSEAAVEDRGTSSAKQEIVMPPPAKSRPPALRATANPTDRGVAEFVATPAARLPDLRIPAPAWQQNFGGGHRDEKPGVLPETINPAASTTPVANSFVAPANLSDEPAAIPRTQVEAIIHRTLEAAERIRTTGGQHVEVQIKLDAGQELTVRLQITHGEVRPVFVTESHQLRQALEQNWSQFSERAADRSLRVTTPIFESPNSQSNMSDLNQHGREDRQRAFAEAQEAALGAGIPFGRKSHHRANAATPGAAPAAGALYA